MTWSHVACGLHGCWHEISPTELTIHWLVGQAHTSLAKGLSITSERDSHRAQTRPARIPEASLRGQRLQYVLLTRVKDLSGEPFRCTELQGLARCGCMEVPSKPCAGYAHWAPNQERWVERSRSHPWTQQGPSQWSGAPWLLLAAGLKD